MQKLQFVRESVTVARVDPGVSQMGQEREEMRNVLKSLVVAAAVFTAASAAHAGMILYPMQSGGGLTITNITETNNTVADSYYGAPTFNGVTLAFPITGTLPFASTSSGAGDSDLLDVKLSFDVSGTSSVPVSAFLSEVGDYFSTGTGTGGDGVSIMIFGPSNTLLASGTSTFLAPPSTASTIWQDSLSVNGGGVASSFHVVIDNVLHTASLAAADSAAIDKTSLSVVLGGGGVGNLPEPASLGVLGLGALTLVGRRRKA
jgi:hypothetical protein